MKKEEYPVTVDGRIHYRRTYAEASDCDHFTELKFKNFISTKKDIIGHILASLHIMGSPIEVVFFYKDQASGPVVKTRVNTSKGAIQLDSLEDMEFSIYDCINGITYNSKYITEIQCLHWPHTSYFDHEKFNLVFDYIMNAYEILNQDQGGGQKVVDKGEMVKKIDNPYGLYPEYRAEKLM